MTYLYRRGPGAKRRVMHLAVHDQASGEPTTRPFCGRGKGYDTTCNVPLGRPTCKRCMRKAWR